jgi:YHS domain-containing protein
MYRLVLIVGLLIILYFLLRRAIRELGRHRERDLPTNSQDMMVQDPVCLTYVPRASAVSAQIGGQTYFFCSRQCAHTFQERLSAGTQL